MLLNVQTSGGTGIWNTISRKPHVNLHRYRYLKFFPPSLYHGAKLSDPRHPPFPWEDIFQNPIPPGQTWKEPTKLKLIA